MKANFALPHGTFDHHFSPSGHGPDFHKLGSQVVTLVRLGFEKLTKAMHPLSFEEEYLSQAENVADLERRMRELQDPNSRISAWRY